MKEQPKTLASPSVRLANNIHRATGNQYSDQKEIVDVLEGQFAVDKVKTMAVEGMKSLAALDLSIVKRRVVLETGWSHKIADYAELRYRRFLCMRLINPQLMLVPPPDIDAFWHQHILFTKKYAQDCEAFFGEFMHHAPASGEESEAAMLQQHALDTARFYAEAFGEHYYAAEPEGIASNWLELLV